MSTCIRLSYIPKWLRDAMVVFIPKVYRILLDLRHKVKSGHLANETISVSFTSSARFRTM